LCLSRCTVSLQISTVRYVSAKYGYKRKLITITKINTRLDTLLDIYQNIFVENIMICIIDIFV